ncbi:MerR family transcriptional regulator [Microbacterium aurugineum]|uniref:MerR family transcriptional regulator n=2 Tax=Microbacterium aurugineum TaxID=2851642 RepID=A0ABY4J668_9MICO|nr:MerR family transcriptional regulator [Microbacterium aurugineum]UPL19581.1 MerR family transcriptional regulator [Microbacterium aurugineum]
MRIGEVADQTSLSFRTLRHYEDVGLVTPTGRTDGGFRLYTPKDVGRLMIVRRMKPLGYTLDEMRAVLDVVDALADEPDSEDLQERLSALRQEATARRERLASQVGMADEFLAQLAQFSAAESPPRPAR